MGKRFDISIIKQHVDQEMEVMEYSGLCMYKFHADVTLVKEKFDSLEVNDIIMLGERKLRIVQIGKHCFDDCLIYSSGSYCPLKPNCAFGMWEHTQ